MLPQPPPDVSRNDQSEHCAVCGAAIEDGADIEDSNGWRWFSDGRGGLLPLCPSCPVPAAMAGARD